jgi:RimJ/RimL family protein N-acetyltransferase
MQPIDLPVGELLLRPWRDDDLDQLATALHDPEVRRWNGPFSLAQEDVAAMLARRRDWSTGDHCSWAVVDARDRLLGSISLHLIDRDQDGAEVGYWTVAGARGRGVAVRAVVAVCAWAFAGLHLDRIVLFHAVGNPASGRVAAKAGFTQEGRLRRSHRYGDGVKHDELLWSRLSDDPPPPALTSRS